MKVRQRIGVVAAFTCILAIWGGKNAHADSISDHQVIQALYKKPPFRIHYSHHSIADIDGTSANITLNQFRTFIRVPVFKWDSGVLAVFGAYSLDIFHLQNSDARLLAEGEYHLHQIVPSLGFTQALGEHWALSSGVMLKISSDFEDDFSQDMLFVEGRIETGWAVSNTFVLRFGLAVHNRFGMYLPIPILGCAYQPQNSRFEFEVLLPKLVRASLHATEYLDLELFAGFDNNLWNINQENLGKFAKHMRIRTGAGATVRFWKGIYLRLAGGVFPFRRFDSYCTDRVEEYDANTSVTPFVETEILISPREWFE